MSAKFCGNCGYALQAQEDPQLERLKKLVPKEFAERLLKSRGGRVGSERRVVTILFCDVKGSTALGETMDPEEVLEIMNPVFDVLIEPVYRYEGTLARLMGDAILAFFGAPIAHEDDPVRAVLAALAMQEKMQEYAAQLEKTRGLKGFAVRVGINTGLVVVGEVGSDLRVEYTAMGDTINVASRFENAAKPGTILISENTARLVKHAFELESLGGLELKGKAEPVPAYRVIGRKAVMEPTRGIEGLHSPLVGRERELQTLHARVDELLHGRGQIISIMGEAGLGKSRLLSELRTTAEGARQTADGGQPSAVGGLIWLEGRSLSYQTSTPYAPFVDLLDNYFKLDPEATDLDKYDQVKSRLAEILPGRVNEIAPFIATLLGIELIGDDLDRIKYLTPPDLREKIFRATLELFERMAGMSPDGNPADPAGLKVRGSPSGDVPQPTVLVFEDLHWADTNSLDLLDRLMPLTDRAMLMLIALFRPQRQEPSWRFHENAAREYAHRYTQIELSPLDEQNSRQLVANLLEIEDLPESVRALILKKAEGNPFFVEEVIRSLLDAKLVVRENSHWRATRAIENIAVPDTLAGVITARLDRLDEDSKHVAQTASVIGREFQFDVLQNVYEEPPALDESLRNLQRRELVREKSRMPLILYLFKHALTQETAYASVLLSKRRALHKRVAECLERVEPDAVNDIARHFYEAQDYSRALPYLIGAGDRAARAYSIPEAIQYFSKAVEATKTVDNLSLTRRAYEGLGGALTFIFDIPRALQTFQEMLQIAQAHDDVPMQVSATNKIANISGMFLGQFEQADQLLHQAENLGRAHDDKPGLSETFFIRCGMCMSMGDFDGVVNYMSQTAQFGHALGAKDMVAQSMDHVARSKLFLTRFDEAYEKGMETLNFAREIGNREIEAAVSHTLASYFFSRGDLNSAMQYAQSGYEIAHRIGSPLNEMLGAWARGLGAWTRGEYEIAVDYIQCAVQSAFPLEKMLPFALVMPLASLGAVLVEIGEGLWQRAELSLSHANELLKNPGGMVAGGTAWAEIGFAELQRGNVAAARENFQKGLSYPTMMGLYSKPRFLVGMALVALAEHDLDDAQRSIEDARAFVEERAWKSLYPLVDWADAQIHAAAAKNAGPARGDYAHALEQFERAELLALEMQMRPMVMDARIGAAKILDALGRTDGAETKRRGAKAMIDEMASLIEDEGIKAAFVESALKKVNGQMEK
jgi:class 3 adenylate cyclase/tetratricopeptide (TPR) repeat protein